MLSVIIITKNESHHIGRCLQSVAWADEIIVFDSGSTDNTVEICNQFGATVFISDWPGFGLQKQRALDQASHEWVLSLDADEEIGDELRQEIQTAMLNNLADGFYIPRLSSYCGKQIKHGGWRPDYVLRLFKRNKGRFSQDSVHERIIINGKVNHLKNDIFHESFLNLTEVLDKVNLYSDLNALKLYKNKNKTSLSNAIIHGLWSFFRTYFVKMSFLDGEQGLMLAISNAEGSYYKYAKLLEMHNQNSVKNKLISVIVSTYNRPDALQACIDSLMHQSDINFEILIADDGSTIETQTTIKYFQKIYHKIPIKHIYQTDKGFRLSKIRNKAISNSLGHYIIFLDGDCIVLPSFIERHRKLSDIGYFVAGNRILLNESFTQEVLNLKTQLYKKTFSFYFTKRIQNKINKITTLIYLPINFFRYLQPYHWKKAVGCNTGVWKEDLLEINGYDENFIGWGYEDSDLLIRLLHKGIKRKEGRFAVPVLHLWHNQNDRSQHDTNYQRLMSRLKDPSIIRAEKGIDQYL